MKFKLNEMKLIRIALNEIELNLSELKWKLNEEWSERRDERKSKTTSYWLTDSSVAVGQLGQLLPDVHSAAAVKQYVQHRPDLRV